MTKIIYTYLFLLLLAINTKAFAQTDTTANQIYTLVEQMPFFPGGQDAMSKFIIENIEYPEKERKAGIVGTCYLTFVVEKDGSISEVRILRGVSGGPGCDKEAVRVIEMMPKWIPGKQNGKDVRVQFNLPIKFMLTRNKRKPRNRNNN